MLKLACKEDLPFIRQLCDNSILGCKILCQALSYGFERPFLEIWLMKDDDIAEAVITRFYDDVTIVADEDFDADQLGAFIAMLNHNSVTLSQNIADKLGFNNAVIKNGYRYSGADIFEKADELTEDDFKKAYELISREIPGSFKAGRDAYLSFLSDFTFRQRRMMARGVCTHCEDKLVSVAVTSSETDKSAVISGVACDKSLRMKGLGKKTVLSIAGKLLAEGKTPYVIALNKTAEGFYEHIGFIKTESIAFIERNKDV